MLENSKLTRNNFNLRATTKINKLSLDGKVSYFRQDVKNRATQGTEGIMAWLYTIPRNLVLDDYKDYQNPADYSVKTIVNGTYGNPYWVLHNDVNKDNRDRMQGYIKATYEIANGLSAFIRVGTDIVTQTIETVNQVGHWYFPSGRFNYSTRTTTESNADFLIMYNKNLSTDFSLNLNAGSNMLFQTYTGQGVYGENFKIPTKATVASAAYTEPSYDPLRKKQIHSLYGSASLSFKNYAYLDLSARNDWSSTLPESNRSYFYPSASLSFLLNEMFEPVGNLFNFAKIRGSWAQVGADTDPYQIESTYSLQQNGYLGLTTLTRPSVKMNPDLKPEHTSSIELGFEFRMFNNRFYGDFTYYNIETKDLIIDVAVPASTGYSYYRENVGLMSNKGVELQLGFIPVQMNDFTWDISMNFAKNKNVLEELTEDLDNMPLSTTNSGTILAQATVGGGFGDFYGYTYLRDPSGNIVVDANGIPRSSQERVYLGNWQPDWTAGMINTITYKSLSLSFLIDMTYGGQIYSGTDAALNGTGVSERTLAYRETGYTYDAVQNTGTEDAPVYENNTTAITAQEYWSSLPTSEYIYDKTNVRLRELSVSYKLPSKLLSNIFIKDITFSLVGRNLFFLYKDMENFDPESSYSTNQFAQGMLYYNMPTTRSFGFNLNIKF
jgi:TonB-linked SusC/RagA family outer membrane protein